MRHTVAAGRAVVPVSVVAKKAGGDGGAHRPGVEVALGCCRAPQRQGQRSYLRSGGQGSSAHLATDLLRNPTSVKMMHVSFKGVAAALANVIAKRIEVTRSVASERPARKCKADWCAASPAPARNAEPCCRIHRHPPRRAIRPATWCTGSAFLHPPERRQPCWHSCMESSLGPPARRRPRTCSRSRVCAPSTTAPPTHGRSATR
jgi:hypothetical protein